MTNLPPDTRNFLPPEERKTKRNYWLLPLTFVLGLGLGIGGTALVQSSTSSVDHAATSQSAFDSTDTEPESEGSSEEAPDYMPETSDFEIALTVKEQECFGSAGCNVTLRVEPSFVGTETPTGQWEITYEVTGIEDEPQIQTFTLDGTEISYEPELRVQTVSESSEPKADVTDIYEGY